MVGAVDTNNLLIKWILFRQQRASPKSLWNHLVEGTSARCNPYIMCKFYMLNLSTDTHAQSQTSLATLFFYNQNLSKRWHNNRYHYYKVISSNRQQRASTIQNVVKSSRRRRLRGVILYISRINTLRALIRAIVRKITN